MVTVSQSAATLPSFFRHYVFLRNYSLRKEVRRPTIETLRHIHYAFRAETFAVAKIFVVEHLVFELVDERVRSVFRGFPAADLHLEALADSDTVDVDRCFFRDLRRIRHTFVGVVELGRSGKVSSCIIYYYSALSIRP